jgi:diguanylate cyclase (GGDEF)-like protein
VAGILGASARKIDIVARYGGEEFAIVLEATDRAGARQLAERIRADVSKQAFKSAKGNFQVTLSLGVASYPEDASAKEIIIARADESLYAAKHAGRNQTVCAADLDKSKSGLKPVRKSA